MVSFWPSGAENGETKRKANLFTLVTKRLGALGKDFPRDDRMSFTVL